MAVIADLDSWHEGILRGEEIEAELLITCTIRGTRLSTMPVRALPIAMICSPPQDFADDVGRHAFVAAGVPGRGKNELQ